MKSIVNNKIFLSLILSGCLILFSCSSDSDSTTYSYNGPGSTYSLELDTDGTFELTESDSSLEVYGTHTTLDSGFTKMTVTSASGTDAPSAGDEAYGIDVPGYVFLLKPLETDADIISMVASGECPTDDFSANWIVTSIEDGQNFEDSCDATATNGVDALGTFIYDHSESLGSLPTKYNICGDTLGSYELGTFTCSSGLATIDDADLYLTEMGGILVNINSDDDDDSHIIVALPSNTIDDTADFDGDYIGLILTNDSSTSTTYPISATFESSTNQFTFDEIDPDTNEIITTNDVNGVSTFSSLNTPNDGFISGTFYLDSATSDTYKLICSTSVDIFSTGKNFLFCIGQTPDSGSDNMFNALLISK